MARGVITKYYETRFADRVVMWMFNKRMFTTTPLYRPIIEDSTGQVVGALIGIRGKRSVVRFLEWLT